MNQTAAPQDTAPPLDLLLERHAAGEITSDIVHDALRRRGQEIVEEFRRRRRQAIEHLSRGGATFAGGVQ